MLFFIPIKNILLAFFAPHDAFKSKLLYKGHDLRVCRCFHQRRVSLESVFTNFVYVVQNSGICLLIMNIELFRIWAQFCYTLFSECRKYSSSLISGCLRRWHLAAFAGNAALVAGVSTTREAFSCTHPSTASTRQDKPQVHFFKSLQWCILTGSGTQPTSFGGACSNNCSFWKQNLRMFYSADDLSCYSIAWILIPVHLRNNLTNVKATYHEAIRALMKVY